MDLLIYVFLSAIMDCRSHWQSLASSFTCAVTDKVIGELTSFIHERSLPLGG